MIIGDCNDFIRLTIICDKYHYCHLLFVDYLDIQLISHLHLITLDLGVQYDVSLVVLNHLRRCCPL